MFEYNFRRISSKPKSRRKVTNARVVRVAAAFECHGRNIAEENLAHGTKAKRCQAFAVTVNHQCRSSVEDQCSRAAKPEKFGCSAVPRLLQVLFVREPSIRQQTCQMQQPLSELALFLPHILLKTKWLFWKFFLQYFFPLY